MLPQCCLMGEEARQGADVLQLFGRELRIDDGILISSICLSIQLESFDTFPAELELESPDILVGVERVRVAFGDESKIAIIQLLPRLVALIVDADEDRSGAKDKAGEGGAISESVPLTRRLDESSQRVI